MEVTTATATQNAASQADAATLNGSFDQFLTLLTTQLQNQDPLSPMETNEFTNQLVSFSGVEQQIKTNEALENLLALNVLNITSIGLGFIGLDVERVGDTVDFDGSTPQSLGYAFGEDATSTEITIKDADGNTVFNTSGEITGGQHEYTWNGLNNEGTALPAGDYTLSVTALDSEGDSIPVTTTVPSRVTGIESGANGDVILIVGDGEKVPITDVRRATQPGT